MREKELSGEHSPSDVKQALAIASKMGGNMTGATAAIEKKSKGLSKHKQVAAVLKRANEQVKEGLGELADVAERDHEVQMARAELYKLAKYAIKLHDMLKGVSEAEGLEGWVQSKITKSADMIGSVYHHMDYDESPMADESLVVDEGKSPHAKGTKKYKKHMAAMHAEGEMAEGPFKGVGKMAMKHKLNKQYKKSDLANFDDSGIDTSGKSPEEVGDMKSDFYHGHMDKAAKAKKAMNRLSRKNESYKESLQDKLSAKLAEGKCCSECGNPSYKSVSEEKKKGSHGKVCWKGFRRGEGNSCHRVKGDG